MSRFLSISLLKGLSLLSWSMIQRLGGAIGALLLILPNRQRRDALINIRLCQTDLSDAEQRELRKRCMVEFARTLIELSALWQWPAPRVLRLIKRESGTALLRREAGKGVIVLAPHLGSWEMAGLYLATKGPTTSMYRPQKHVDDIILAARQRNGAVLAPDDVSGVKRLYRALKKGEYVGILPDQVAREESGSVFAPFFGVPAVTILLVAGLARRTGSRVVFMFAERLPEAGGFHIRCLPAPPGIDSSDEQTAARALNQGVEQCIACCPEQYQWTYRRFRRRPDNAPSPYTGPSI
jgi:KDO2-lipid IV(A) lauroyltransferase